MGTMAVDFLPASTSCSVVARVDAFAPSAALLSFGLEIQHRNGMSGC